MPFNFDEPCKFQFELELNPDGSIHTSYTTTPRSALLFSETFDRVSNFIDYLCESIVFDFSNLGESPKNKED